MDNTELLVTYLCMQCPRAKSGECKLPTYADAYHCQYDKSMELLNRINEHFGKINS